MSLLLTTVVVVVVISAICSLFEAVLYAVPVSHVESLAQSGKRCGKVLQQLKAEVDRPIAAILGLNTIANTAGAAVAGAAADQVLGSHLVAAFSAGFTFLILTFSEILPKTLGVVHSRMLAPFIARPLQALVWGLTPLVWFSTRLTGLISRGRTPDVVTQDELITLARLAGHTGTIGTDQARAVGNILALELKSVSRIMTPRSVVFTLDGNLTVGEVRSREKEWTHGRMPVYDEGVDDIVGVVHRRKLLGAIGEDRFQTRVMELMSPVHFVPPTLALDRLLASFLEKRQHLFVVVDEFGTTLGVVTLEDVLEEILGLEIVDEFDTTVDLRELARSRRKGISGSSPTSGPT